MERATKLLRIVNLTAWVGLAVAGCEKADEGVAPGPDLGSADAGTDTSATGEVVAPGDDVAEPAEISEEDAAPSDAPPPLPGDVTPPTDDALTTTDASPVEDTSPPDATALPAGCCGSASDCDPDQVCVGLDAGLGWCLPAGTNTACWSDTDCTQAGTVCHLPAPVFACGAPEATPPAAGQCFHNIPCSSVCEDSAGCGEQLCLAGMCLPYGGAEGCWSDDFCDLGAACVGGVVPEVSLCSEEVTSVPAKQGECYAGSGETCVVLGFGDFGTCETQLGYALFSHLAGCVPVLGCDCGAWCDQIFPTKLECQLACTPQTCCSADSDCPAGAECVSGNCLPAAPEDGCWDAEDCGEGQFCDASVSCACNGGKCKKLPCKKGLPCKQPKMATAGSCHPIPACCDGEGQASCGDGEVCHEGACLPAPAAGQCWSDAACPEGEYCFGAAAAECGAFAVPLLGVCLPTGVTCCVSDDQCAGSCVNGYCIAPVEEGQCWTDYDCALGTTCDGALAHTSSCFSGDSPNGTPGTCIASGEGGLCVTFTWPSSSACDETASLGFTWAGTGCIEVYGCDCEPWCSEYYTTEAACLAACAPALCCGSDVECPPSTVCFEGHCIAPPPVSGCYSDADCLASEQCLGADACTCGTNDCKLGCKAEPCPQPMVAMGYCAPKPTCCTTSAECGEGSVCLDWLGGESRCAPAPAEDQCYRPEDCAGGMTCENENPCTCSDIWCVPSAGTCSPATSGCCDDDGDCLEGSLCTKDALGGGPASGQCVVLFDSASCYSDKHCAPGHYCGSAWAPVCGEEGDPVPGQCYPF